MDFEGKRVTVMGLGLHGGAVGTVRWLAEQGADITGTDMKSRRQLVTSIDALRDLENVRFVLGEHREEDFTEADLVVRNPAVPRDSKYLKIASDAGVSIEMDSSLFLKNVPDRARVIGVTGTKGKSTTTYFIGELMKLTGDPVVVTGIEGTSPLRDMHGADEKTWIVFELSSWRLEALHEHKISPGVAVVTSIYKDHLNTYDSFEDYIEAKKAIIKYQTADDLVLLNADDELVRRWEKDVRGELVWYGAEDGDHVRKNKMPGIILARRAGVSDEKIAKTVSQLKGLPHRLELLAEIDGVKYINDSSATVPDAAVAALEAYSDESIIHILGGNDKELDFSEWAKVAAKSDIKKFVWLQGEVTAKMKGLLIDVDSSLTEKFVDASSMKEAVKLANDAAEEGDVVLLSPGATSFALFKDEFDRGNQFREAVEKLGD